MKISTARKHTDFYPAIDQTPNPKPSTLRRVLGVAEERCMLVIANMHSRQFSKICRLLAHSQLLSRHRSHMNPATRMQGVGGGGGEVKQSRLLSRHRSNLNPYNLKPLPARRVLGVVEER